MTEAELRTMIDEGKSLDEIASEMAAGETLRLLSRIAG